MKASNHNHASSIDSAAAWTASVIIRDLVMFWQLVEEFQKRIICLMVKMEMSAREPKIYILIFLLDFINDVVAHRMLLTS